MAQVSYGDVLKMLDVCAEGHERRETKHHLRVSYRGRLYPSLPLGQHSRRKSQRGEIALHYVRAMCKELGILDCASAELPQLRRGRAKGKPQKSRNRSRERGAGRTEITLTFRRFDAENEEQHRALIDVFNREGTVRLRLSGREFHAEQITKIPTEDDLTMVVRGKWVDS